MPTSEVYNIDCLAAMREMPDKAFGLAIVDPPYGISASEMQLGNGKNKLYKKGKKWDDSRPTDEYFKQLFRVSKNQIIWGGNYFADKLIPSRCWIFWDKMKCVDSFADGELAWTSFDKNTKKIQMQHHGFINADMTKPIHPTQKPIALYKWLLQNYAKPGDTILDTHLGSGSSRIAAYDMGFDFTGYELDAEYFNASDVRFKNHISNLKLFAPDEMYRPEQARMF